MIRPSVLAGIIDTYGNIRYVVTQRSKLKHHRRHDEVCIVVRGVKVFEPIPWDEIPYTIRRIQKAVNDWLERGLPNEPYAREAAIMYCLRCQEQDQESLDLSVICET